MAKVKSQKRTQQDWESVGARLKKVREDKGISLEEAHRVTRMHPNVLEAIEKDKLEHVLGKAYVKAFLKKYADYLGLDGDEIMREYARSQSEQDKEGPVLTKQPIASEKKILSGAPVFKIVAAITVIAMAFFLIRAKSGKRDAEVKSAPVKTEVSEPEQEAAAVYSTNLIPIPKSRTIKLTVTTDKEVWLKVNRDGELTFHGILPRNAKETWQADNEIRLSEIGRPKALSLNVNGKNIDTSKHPLSRNILISHEGIDVGSR